MHTSSDEASFTDLIKDTERLIKDDVRKLESYLKAVEAKVTEQHKHLEENFEYDGRNDKYFVRMNSVI